MDFTSLLDTWWFRIITLPIEFIIFYYVGKWFAKRSPLRDEKYWEDAEKYEKKIINWFKELFIKEKKRGPFL
ncbi:hypothetical protein OAJ01_00505 [Flavobacteriaceae bacterium]|nr:hypothetical protein [Flavobacteriaceae bacterium]